MPLELKKALKDERKMPRDKFYHFLESLDHIAIYYLDIANGIDIHWDYSNFFHWLYYTGLNFYIPREFLKIIASKSNGLKQPTERGEKLLSAFNFPKAYYELRAFLVDNKELYLESDPDIIIEPPKVYLLQRYDRFNSNYTTVAVANSKEAADKIVSDDYWKHESDYIAQDDRDFEEWFKDEGLQLQIKEIELNIQEEE